MKKKSFCWQTFGVFGEVTKNVHIFVKFIPVQQKIASTVNSNNDVPIKVLVTIVSRHEGAFFFAIRN